jgi:hypothetical protein
MPTVGAFGARVKPVENPGGKSAGGYEIAHTRVDPNGGITLSVGTRSHGPRTVYAWLVSDWHRMVH